LLLHPPHDAGFHILILEINVFTKRSAPQVKRSSSAALVAPYVMITFSFSIEQLRIKEIFDAATTQAA
jgi:hypothetical protein